MSYLVGTFLYKPDSKYYDYFVRITWIFCFSQNCPRHPLVEAPVSASTQHPFLGIRSLADSYGARGRRTTASANVKQFNFPNTVYYPFYASAKSSLRGGKLYGGRKDIFVPSTLRKKLCKIENRFHILCVQHVMIAVSQFLLAADII